jgi:hypothetical protein
VTGADGTPRLGGLAERVATLVDADAVTIGWDASILAEACGVSPAGRGATGLGEPLPSLNPAARPRGARRLLLEAARRLAVTL